MGKVDFNIIRYANCWEDARLLNKGLEIKPGDGVLGIASGGDNCFALLVNSPRLVVAADVSLPQLFITELKAKAIEKFERNEFLEFIGITEGRNPVEYYHEVKDLLSRNARNYWDQRLPLISSGLVNAGKFERYFSLFRKYVMPLVHSKKEIRFLLEKKTATEQLAFYTNTWNSKRWKLFFSLFFSETVMGVAGRDPAFMKEVEVNVGKHIFSKAENHLSDKLCQENPFLHFIFTGSYGPVLPEYLSVENYPVIRRNIGALELRTGFIQDVILPGEKFNAMNLSNIFEYMDVGTFKEISPKLINAVDPGAKLAYWNLMVPRIISSHFEKEMKLKERLSKELTRIDHGFFYDRFIVDQRI